MHKGQVETRPGHLLFNLEDNIRAFVTGQWFQDSLLFPMLNL